MKTTKLLVLLTVTFLMTSCSKEEEDYNFAGVWDLSSINVRSSEFYDYSGNQLNGTLQSDENCFTNSTLSIFSNKTALLSLTSKVETIIQVIDGTTNELEQILTCVDQEEQVFLTMETGDQVVLNEDGTTTVGSSSSDFPLIRFLDENGQIVLSGFKLLGDGLAVTRINYDVEPILVEVEGEQLEYGNSNTMIFKR